MVLHPFLKSFFREFEVFLSSLILSLLQEDRAHVCHAYPLVSVVGVKLLKYLVCFSIVEQGLSKLLITKLVMYGLCGNIHSLCNLVEIEMECIDLLAARFESQFEAFIEPVLVIYYQ